MFAVLGENHSVRYGGVGTKSPNMWTVRYLRPETAVELERRKEELDA
jgi:hypothetical protein